MTTTKKTTAPSEPKKKRKPTPASFQKGHPKVGGRKPGTPNKVTRDARSILGETLLSHLEHLDEYIDGIDDDAKRIQAIASLMPFYVPKLQSTTLSADTHRSLSCEEEMAELEGKFKTKEIEISVTEREIFNFDEDPE